MNYGSFPSKTLRSSLNPNCMNFNLKNELLLHHRLKSDNFEGGRFPNFWAIFNWFFNPNEIETNRGF